MEFIREKIKEKPVSKRKIFMKIGGAAICGFVFSIVVLIMMTLFMPVNGEALDTEQEDSQQETDSQQVTEETQSTEPAIVIPSDLSLSISDYQILQDEL